MRIPVSSPWAPAAGWSVTARIPLISASACLELPQELERALGDLVGRERVERGEAGQAGRPLVELRVELHRARAERIEARVDRVVELRQVDVVADDLGLVELGQGRRRRAPGGRPGSGPGRPSADAGSCRRRGRAGPLEQRRLERSPTTLIGPAPRGGRRRPLASATSGAGRRRRRRRARRQGAANRAISSSS